MRTSDQKTRREGKRDGPRVSIVTPSYNQVRFLEQCLLSVLNQDYRNIEYIVIDGGSTDGSTDIIRKYEGRIDYWISESDAGQSHAINKGMRIASGDIVAWLNSDDIYFPSAVSHAAREFKNNKNLALFYGNCVFIDEHGSFLRYFTEVEEWNECRLRNFTDFVMQPTAFFSREKLNQAGLLDEKLHFGMDWDLWCRLARTGDVCYRNLMIAANRDYKETKTNNGSWKRLFELLTINLRHMTGIWPHAFFGFCGTELRQKAEATNNPFQQYAYRLLRVLLMAMSPVAALQSKRNRHGRNLYGIRHHSGIVEDGEATIHLPIIDAPQAFEISLKTASVGTVEIRYQDENRCFALNGNVIVEIMPLNNQSFNRGHLEIDLIFRDPNGALMSGEILNVGFVPAARQGLEDRIAQRSDCWKLSHENS